jgi:hypothetical protein
MTTAYSFNQPVTSPQYTHLRQAHWQADQLISLCDNVIAFEAELSATVPAVSGGTAAALAYTSVITGSYTNIDEGMVVIVSPTSDPRYPTAVRLRARMDGVANVVATSSVLYVNEFSDILGLGAHVWAFYAYDLIDALSRPTGTSPNVVQLEDYNHPYTTPAPVIRGPDTAPLQTAYADWVDSAGHYDIAFDATGSSSPRPRGSIASYQYSVVPTGSGVATVIAGDPATANVTYQFTAGEYFVRIDATDDLGVTNFRHILVKAHSDAYPPNDGFEGVEITRDIAQGPSARVKYYDGVSTLLNGTLAIFWTNELYSDEGFGNSSGSLFGNIDLIGWIETQENQFQTDPTYSAYSEVQFEVQGVGSRLARIEGQLLAITNAASPTAWDQLENNTPWRACIHFLQTHTQVLHLCDFTSNDLTDTYMFPTITTIGGNAFDNVSGQQGIAQQIRSAIEFARDGRMALITRADFYDAPSSELTQVATWTGDDIVGQFTLKMNQYVQYGFINADGASWPGGNAVPIPVLSRAPGLAQASGVDQGQFNNQILQAGVTPAGAQAQLNAFAGTQFVIDNNTTELTMTHPDGYWWIETSFGQLFIIDLDASYSTTGQALDSSTLWMVKTVTVSHDNKAGTRQVQVTYIPVVSGFPGATVPIINNSAITPPTTIPPMPAFNFELPETSIPDAGLPASPITPPTTAQTGEIVLEVGDSGADLYICQNYILLAAPTWRSYTPPLPSGYKLADACFDQLGSTGGAVAVYALANNGTDSIIFYNANVVDGTSAWTQTGTPFAGAYTQIRAAGTPGSVEVFTPGLPVTSWSYSWDFLLASHASAMQVDFGAWTIGQGWNGTGPEPGGGLWNVELEIMFNCLTAISHIDFTYNSGGGAGAESNVNIRTFPLVNAGPYTDYGTPVTPLPGPGTNLSFTHTEDRSGVGGFVIGINSGSVNVNNSVINLTFSGTGVDPFSCPSADMRYSSDYGATVGSPLALGDTPGLLAGFDLARVNGISYAPAKNEVLKATTLGGAYSSFATPTATPISICIPYYEVGSATVSQTGSSSPQVVVGFASEISGSCLYWYDGSATPTAITNPVSNAVFDRGDCIAMLRGKKIAVIVNVSGTRKLYVAEDLVSGGSCTWTFVKNVGATATLRSRRNDPRNASHKGQLFVFDDTDSGYSSKWANAGEFNRVSPTSDILQGDVLG